MGESTYEESIFSQQAIRAVRITVVAEGRHVIFGGPKTDLTFPVIEYTHVDHNCSITGSYVYRGTGLPELVGRYVFADYCSGKVWTLKQIKA